MHGGLHGLCIIIVSFARCVKKLAFIVMWLATVSIRAEPSSVGTLVDPYTGEEVPLLYYKMRSFCSRVPEQNYGIYFVTVETSKGRWTTGTLRVAGKSFNFPVDSPTVGGTLAVVLVCVGFLVVRRLRKKPS